MKRLIATTDSETYLLKVVEDSFPARGFYIRWTGTNSATAVAVADLGRLRAWWQQKPVWDIRLDFLSALGNVIGGNPRILSTASGAMDFDIYIPCGWGDDNILDVKAGDKFTIEWVPDPNYATRLASGNDVRIYADVEEGLQSYVLTLKQVSENLNASQDKPLGLTFENVVAIFGSDIVSSVLTLVSSPLNQIGLNLGRYSGQARVLDLSGYTNNVRNLESNTNLIAELYSAQVGDLANVSKLQDSFTLLFQNGSGGAATPQVFVVGALHTADRLQETVDRNLQQIQERFDLKRGRNWLQSARLIKTYRPEIGVR